MISTVTRYDSLEQEYFLASIRNSLSEAHRVSNDTSSPKWDTLH